MKRFLAALAAALALSATSATRRTIRPDRSPSSCRSPPADRPTSSPASSASISPRRSGQQFIVENIAGAGGTTGITRGAQAKPDGYTIMMGHMGTHGAAPALYPNLRYDPTKDFEPIGLAAGTPILIVARKDFPAADLKEFIAKAKDTSQRLSQAHAGVGSVSHRPARCSTRSSASSTTAWSPIAAPDRRSTTWSAGRSTTCATRSSTSSSR